MDRRSLATLWALAAAAFWLVPDQKLIRAKLLAVQAVVLLAGGAVVFFRARRRGPGASSPLDLPAAGLAAAGLFFWVLSPDLAVSQGEAARLFFCALAFWAASRSFASTGPAAFLTAWSAGASAAALWAVAQWASGQPRPFASFGNPIFLGTALASALPIALARSREPGGRRSLWAAAAALQAGGLLLTHSRAAIFGLLAGLALWALARLKGRRLAAALSAAAALAAAAAWAFRGREWTHGLIWRDALALWRAQPFLGCGLGRFHLEFPAFASEALKARWPEGRVIVNFAHNEYLQTLAETGPLGLFVLCAAPAAAWLALRRDDGSSPGALDRAAATAGALALFAAAFTSPDLRFGASAFAAFALLAAGVRAKEGGPAAPAAVPLCALLAFLGLAVQPALAVRRNALEAPFHDDAAAGRVPDAERRLALSPGDADAAEELGFTRAKASDFSGARAAFLRAAELDPARPGPLNNLGNLSYLAGDFDGAIGWWEKSLAAAPEQVDARLNLAKLLCERGRLKACSRHLDEVLRREPGNAKARVLYKKMIE